MRNDMLLVLWVPRPRRDDATEAAGFSRRHSQLNRRERVQGYGDYVRFEVLCDESTRIYLLRALQDIAGRDHFRYWVMPVLEEGSVGP